MFLYERWGPGKACTIFEVPIGSTSIFVEQDSADKNLLGRYNLDWKKKFK